MSNIYFGELFSTKPNRKVSIEESICNISRQVGVEISRSLPIGHIALLGDVSGEFISAKPVKKHSRGINSVMISCTRVLSC